MLIVAITDFRDKTTAKRKDKMQVIKKGTLIECDETLAKDRINLGLAIEVLNPEILSPKTDKNFFNMFSDKKTGNEEE